MSSSTGVTLGFVDETQEPNGTPEVEPLNWAKLDPKLAAGIVNAQRLATTVDNDGLNAGGHGGGSGYRYPTQAAIACKAREAMGESKIAIVQIGWKLVEREMIYAEFVIVHEDGPCSPVFGATMAGGRQKDPAKSISAGLSTLRKYVLAGLLNMGWRDPSEDIDASSPQGQQRATSQPQQSPAKQKPRDPIAEHRDAAVRDARSWAKWLISRGLAASNLLHYATGCDGEMPNPPPTSVLQAISLAGHTMHAESESDEAHLTTMRHLDLVEFMVSHEIVPLWSYGKRSADGDSVDEKWPIGR